MVGKKGTQPDSETGDKEEKMTVEIRCPYCNFSKTVLKEKIPAGVRWATCPRCKQRFEFEPPDSANAPPWERRSELGLWEGLYQTFKAVLFSPSQFFRGMTPSEGIKEPLAFGLLLGSIGSMFGFFWQFLVMSGKIIFLASTLLDKFTLNFIFLGIIIISPLFVLMNIFITGFIIHICLMIVRGNRSGFNGTFRVVAFSQATQILSFIPFIGGVAGWIWHLIVLIIGFKEIHKITYFRVIVALLLPVGFVFLVIIAAMITLALLF